MENTTGDTPPQEIILIDTNWDELPQSLQNREGTFGFLGSGFTQKNKLPSLTEFINNNKLDDAGLCKIVEDNKIYLVKITGNPVPRSMNCQIDMGTAEQYKESYSNYKGWVQTLPEGTSKFLVFYVMNDQESSILGVKKNDGITCFTWLKPSQGYTPFQNC